MCWRAALPFRTSANWRYGLEKRYNEVKCTVLHLGQNNHVEQDGLGTDWLGNASTGEGLQVLVGNNLAMNQQCTRAAMKANIIFGNMGKNIANRSRELIIPLCLTVLRPHLEKRAQCWTPPIQEMSAHWSKSSGCLGSWRT